MEILRKGLFWPHKIRLELNASAQLHKYAVYH